MKKEIPVYKAPTKRRKGQLVKELRRLVSAYEKRRSKRALAEIARFCKLDNPSERGCLAEGLAAIHSEMPKPVERVARELARVADNRVGRIGANALYLVLDDYAKCKRAVMARVDYDPDYVEAMICSLCYDYPDDAAADLPKLFKHRSRAVRLGALHGLEAIGAKHPGIAFKYLDDFRATEDEVEQFWVKHVLALNLIPQKTAFSMRRLKAWLKEGGEVTREIVEEAVRQARKHYAIGKEKVPGLYENLKETVTKWAEDGSVYVRELGEKLKKSFKK